jgi:YD repeat-containing protein
LVSEAGAVHRLTWNAKGLLTAFRAVAGVTIITNRAFVGIDAARCAAAIGLASGEHPAIPAHRGAIGVDATSTVDGVAVRQML